MTKHYANRPSRLLNEIQNNAVIHALRQNCTALVITVAVMRVYYITGDTVIKFGIVTIERDAKMKKYFFRFYSMENLNLLLQREIKKSIGTPFTVLGDFYIQFKMETLEIFFEFVETRRQRSGLYEYNEVKQGLCGNLKMLKYLAAMRYYTDNPHMYSLEKESQFSRLIRGKDKGLDSYRYVKKHSLPPSEKSPLTDKASEPVIRNLLLHFGINSEDVYKRKDCSQEVEKFIAEYGGFDNLKKTAVQHGIDLDEGLPESSTLTSATSPEIPTLSSVPKTPPKLVLDRIAAFDPAKQVEIPKNDDICKLPEKRLEEEEEFVASELIPDKDASVYVWDADSPCLAMPGTSEKVAEPAAKEKVRKRFLPDAFYTDVNRMRQRISETVRKYKAEKKLKKEQKAKKGQPVSTTPEQKPEKEAPKETEKTPVKEASKTPEKNPSSVSDTTDETESDSDDNSA